MGDLFIKAAMAAKAGDGHGKKNPKELISFTSRDSCKQLFIFQVFSW